MEARPDLPRRLAEAGIPFGFMSAGAVGFRHDGLRLMAGLAVASGLDEKAALAALTTGAAAALGLEERLGRMQVGQVAALQVRSGDLLGAEGETRAMVLGRHVFGPNGEKR